MTFCGKPDSPKHFLLYFTAFNILGFLGNYFSLPLFFGVDFIFGSIITVIAIQAWGKKWGAITALIVSSYTYFLWGHPFAIIIFAAEAIFMGELHSRKYNLVIADALYWLIIGTPLIYIFYKLVLGMDWTATILIMLKQSANGIFNTLIASLLVIHYTPIKRLLGSGSYRDISLQHILFNTVILLVMLPTLFFVIYEGKSAFNKINEEIDNILANTSYQVSEAIRLWFTQQFIPIDQLAKDLSSNNKPPEQIQQQLKLIQQSFPSYRNIYVADREATTVAFYPGVNEKDESTIGLNFSDRLYYKKLKEEMKPYISDVFTGRGGVYTPTAIVAVPIIRNGQFDGYVLGTFDLEVIKKLIDLTVYHDNLKVALIDRNNRVLASTSSEFKVMDEYSRIDNIERAKKRLYIGPQGEMLPEMIKWKNPSYVQITLLNDMLPWRLIVEAPLEYCQKSLYNIYIKILSSALASILLGIIIAFHISRRITAPLGELAKATNTLPYQVTHDSKITAKPGIPSDIKEIRTLTSNFQLMENNLRKAFRDLKLKQKTLEYLAYRDRLTGLPNRAFIKKYFGKVISGSRNIREKYIMLIDIDGFKKINEGFGPDIGDALLKDFALRINRLCAEKGLVARQGEDEFIAVINNVKSKRDLEQFISKIIQEMTEPFNIHGIELNITVSIGISVFPHDGRDFKTLVKYADVALYSAKKEGKNNCRFFNIDMLEPILKNLQIEKGLRKALENKEFLLHYQPQVETETGKIAGIEALIRWNHPQFGIVSPEVFITVAEETGLIIALGEWVIRSVCEQISSWKNRGFNIFPVSVNISVLQFLHGNVGDYIIKTLHEFNIDPKYLKVEITESLGINNMQTIVKELAKLNKHGVNVILDDFGKGYSSLTYLQKLPINSIKIDKSFIDNINDKYNKSIIKIIIDVAHSLELKVVAEGVEKEEQLNFLKMYKCDEIQGYLISKPLPANKFEEKFLC